jgi:arsenite methyltransferase
MERDSTLREKVKEAYSAIAADPEGDTSFPNGRALAEDAGYPASLLDTLPAIAVEAFCANLSLFADISEGATVLDLGVGAGLDTLIASRRTGERGRVLGMDFSAEMLTRAKQATLEAAASNVELTLADAEALPLADESVDVALVNGIFNINPARQAIFCELFRVLRPGGTVYAAELVLAAPLPKEEQNAANWFA